MRGLRSALTKRIIVVGTHFVNVNLAAAAFAALLVDHGYRIFHPPLLA